jgi:microcystin-dependent protein
VIPFKKRLSHEKEATMADNFVGEIRPWGGTFAPVGWALCDGSLISISNFQVLYTLIGTTYGGDGVNTFGLPNLQGRCVIHQGQGSGLSNYVIGQPIGAETVTVSVAQMGAHTHSFSATNTAATTATPGPTVVLATSPANLPIYDGTASPVSLSPASTTPAGGSIPHDNRQPYLAVTYIIALEGIFPSQS